MTRRPSFDLQYFMPYLLNQAAEASSLAFQQYYKRRYGMLRTEWRVLFHLGRYGSLTAKEICERASIHKTKVSRAVAALEKRRFVTRKPLETDRRHEVLTLTVAGQKALDDLMQEAQKFNEGLMSEFSADEWEVLKKCLRRIIRTNSKS